MSGSFGKMSFYGKHGMDTTIALEQHCVVRQGSNMLEAKP